MTCMTTSRRQVKWRTFGQCNAKELLKRMTSCSMHREMGNREISAALLMHAGQSLSCPPPCVQREGAIHVMFTGAENTSGRNHKKWVLLSLPLGTGSEYRSWLFPQTLLHHLNLLNRMHMLLFWLKEKRTTFSEHFWLAGRRDWPYSEASQPLGLHGHSVHFKKTKSGGGKQDDTHRWKFNLKQGVFLLIWNLG